MRLEKLRNKLCYCNSGKKYKKCHFFQNKGLIKTDRGYEIPEIDLTPDQRMGKLIYKLSKKPASS